MYLDTSKSPLLLGRQTFDKVGKRHDKVASVIGRAWSETVHAADYFQDLTREQKLRPRTERVVVDFGNVMQTIRHLETGENHFLLLGKTAWDIIADINNHDLRPDDPDYLISWSDAVHPDFRNGQLRKQQAANRLFDSYVQLAESAQELSPSEYSR